MRKAGSGRRYITENYALPGMTGAAYSGARLEERLGEAYQDVSEARNLIGAEASRSVSKGLGPQLTDPWIHPGLRRFTYNQLLDPVNFQLHSNIDVLKVSGMDSQLRFDRNQSDAQVEETLESLDQAHDTPSLLALCINLEPDDAALFNFRASVSRSLTKELFARFNIHSGFMLDLLGRPNYWSSVSQWKEDGSEEKAAFEFFCQHPRWHQRGRYDKGQQTATLGNKAPASVYMHHSPARNLTLYVIVAPEGGEWFSFVDRIQQDYDAKDDPKATPKAIATSPFMLHALIGSIAFEQSTDYNAEIRTRLMEQLKKINFDEEPGNGIPTRAVNTLRDMEGRFELEGITIHLNQVSQMINTGLSSVFSSIQHSERLLSAHKTFCERNRIGAPGTLVDRTNGILHYLLDAFQCQQNYLNGYNLRKETAMNFVFHIVTQQDSATNLKVAYRMSNDSSSMNTVTILTMIFLPGTFTATVFSSVAFRAADSGAAETTDYLWPFISVAIALTVFVIGFWYWWRRLNTVKPSKAYSM
ncbi:hypothetical protein AK830_g7256 [Neonectria ditissima]|uniref:Uncharacterized protein n=1 Tax=Neonectria ditissima TaxID=78410 RepID=A0A0N8H6L8_9HYPO|nr:hypothetical protein AK830_g7256 [Neonectria ditissima]